MKRALLLLTFILGIAALANAQNPIYQGRPWTGTGIGPTVRLINTDIYSHRLIWQGLGTRTTCTVKVSQSADGTTWTDLIADQTCTTDGSATASGWANYIRINVSALTGTGNTLYTTYVGSQVAEDVAGGTQVNVAQINGITPLMGNGVTGTGSQRVTIASNNTPFPIKTDQTTHGTTDLTAADLYVAGAVNSASNPAFVKNYSGSLVSGLTSAMTATTSTVVLAAVASNYNYVTQCAFSNTHASVTTMMTLQDGSGGTSLGTYVVPFGSGNNIVFPVPLKVPTIGNGLYVVNVTTGSNTFASCSGFASTVSY